MRPPDGGEFSLDFQGELLWTLAAAGQLIYIETGLDLDRDTDPPRYRLNRIDITTLARDTLSVPYQPRYLPEGCRLMDYGEERGDRLRIRLSDDAQEILRNTEYYPPLKQLFSDGSALFAFSFCERDTAAWLGALTQKAGPREADIIDLSAFRLAARAEFDFLPDGIRHGLAYRIVAPAEALARLEIYRLDPRLIRSGR